MVHHVQEGICLTYKPYKLSSIPGIHTKVEGIVSDPHTHARTPTFNLSTLEVEAGRYPVHKQPVSQT